jgi:hypothetical protein
MLFKEKLRNIVCVGETMNFEERICDKSSKWPVHLMFEEREYITSKIRRNFVKAMKK